MVKSVGFNGCKVSLASTSIQYLNTMIIYMVIIINVFIFLPRRVSCHFVTCHFSNDFDVTKKEEVYNILIINNLYINIYFFCFQFLEKWQVTSDNLPITTFNVLILSILRTQICHFSVSLFRELSLFDCNQKCTNRAIWGVNR